MSLEPLGASTSEVEVTGITAHGVWLLAGEDEMFLSYEDFPWFKEVSVREILNVQEPTPGHYYWPELDVDLGVENHTQSRSFPTAGAAQSIVWLLGSRRTRQATRAPLVVDLFLLAPTLGNLLLDLIAFAAGR